MDDEALAHLVDVFDRAAAGLAIGDGAGTQLLRVNPALCELLGRTEEEILGHDLREFTHPDDLALTDAERRSGMREGYEKRYVRPDGSIVWALVGGELVTDGAGNPKHFVGSIVDISARKHAEEELERIVSRQNAVLALGRMALGGRPLDELFAVALRLVGDHLDVERAAVLELLPGGAELLLRAGRGWMSAVEGQLRLPVDASQGGYAILKDEPVTTDDFESEARFHVPRLRMESVRSALSVVIHVDGRPWGTLGAHTVHPRAFGPQDVAFLQTLADVLAAAIARHEHEEVARRALDQDQLAIVGRVAAGLAHDFNNVLSVIKMHGDLLATAPDITDESRQHASAIREQAEHAIALVWQLLDVARRQDYEPSEIDLHEFLENLTPLLRRNDGVAVEISTELADTRAVVLADRGRLNQVILNLVSNALDASPSGGKVCVRTTVGPDGAGAMGVTLSVIDHGEGMTAEVAARAFEPFFSTKGAGKGTGLGLAQVKALVEQHHGRVELETSAGHGTVVSVWLPVAARRAHFDDDGGPIPRGAGELVLVANGDGAVRSSVAGLLGELGYATVLARDEAEAVELLEGMPGVSLAFIDLDAPHMDGARLDASLTGATTGVPMVLASAERPSPARGTGPRRIHWLRKPYKTRDLAEMVAACVRS